METKENCATCSIRAKYDAKPQSLAGRFWRWHINWCPGWKKYMASLTEEEKQAISEKYRLKRR